MFKISEEKKKKAASISKSVYYMYWTALKKMAERINTHSLFALVCTCDNMEHFLLLRSYLSSQLHFNPTIWILHILHFA